MLKEMRIAGQMPVPDLYCFRFCLIKYKYESSSVS